MSPEAMGLSSEPDEHREIVIEVEPENGDAVRLARQMQSQWRTSPTVIGKHLVFIRTGLDYGVLGPVAAALAIALDERVLDGLRALETEMLTIFAERQHQLLQRR